MKRRIYEKKICEIIVVEYVVESTNKCILLS